MDKIKTKCRSKNFQYLSIVVEEYKINSITISIKLMYLNINYSCIAQVKIRKTRKSYFRLPSKTKYYLLNTLFLFYARLFVQHRIV